MDFVALPHNLAGAKLLGSNEFVFSNIDVRCRKVN